MIFQYINVCPVPREMLKTSAYGLGFQHLPRDLANVNAWKNMFDPYITTRVITLWCKHVTLLTTSVSTMRFLIEIMFVLNVIKSHFKGSYDKQNLTLVVILYEIMKLAKGSFHKFHMK